MRVKNVMYVKKDYLWNPGTCSCENGKAVTFHNVIILIKSVVNKNENSYFYNIFIEKGLYEDKPNIKYFLMNVCIL